MHKQQMYEKIILRSLAGLGLLIAFFLARRLMMGASSVLSASGQQQVTLPGSVSPQLANQPEAPPTMIQAPNLPDISEDIYMNKLSPEARAKLKAHDKMMTEVVDHAKTNPADASRLIRSWLTEDLVAKQTVVNNNVDQ